MKTLERDAWDVRKLGVEEFVRPVDAVVFVDELVSRDRATWIAGVGSPAECFFASTSAPTVVSLDDPHGAGSDDVRLFGVYHDAGLENSFVQSARVFDSTDAAESYLAELEANVRACSRETFVPPGSAASVELTFARDLDAPGGIDVVGWTMTEAGITRQIVFDIQSANAVVRLAMTTQGDMTEARFASFALTYLRQVALNAP